MDKMREAFEAWFSEGDSARTRKRLLARDKDDEYTNLGSAVSWHAWQAAWSAALAAKSLEGS